MNIKSVKFWSWSILLVAIFAFAIGVLLRGYQEDVQDTFETEAATILESPRTISKFELIDNHGNAFTNENLKDKWTFMFFGYTSCPGICPTILKELVKVYEKLHVDEGNEKIQVVMVSIDPERDSVERMNNYVTAFNPSFIGLKGTSDQIKSMTKELGIVYLKVVADEADTDMSFEIDHSGALLLFNPKGELHALFSMPHDSEEIVGDFKVIEHIRA